MCCCDVGGAVGKAVCDYTPPPSPDVDGFLQKMAERKAAEQTQDNRSFLQKYVSCCVCLGTMFVCVCVCVRVCVCVCVCVCVHMSEPCVRSCGHH